MHCPKCNFEITDPGAKFCPSCGSNLMPAPDLTKTGPDRFPKRITLIVGVGLLLLLALVFGLNAVKNQLMSKNTALSSGKTVTQNDTAASTSSAENASQCDKLYQELEQKYGKDYSSCLTQVTVQPTDCTKPTGLGDPFKENLNVLIILDSSGSMAENIAGGQKMAVAKQAISDFVSKLPDRAQVGLMVYGHKGSNSTADKPTSCAGIEMIYPISKLDKAKFETAVNSFSPTGWTPIAAALQQAQSAFSKFDAATTSNLIYLVSDGIETCDGNPVQAAKDINASSNTKAIVNIVGLAVDNQGQIQLKNISAAAGGEFYLANSATEMSKIFDNQAKAVQEYSRYWLCNVTNQNKIWLALTNQSNGIWLCITNKSNSEWLNMVREMNHWPLDDPRLKCNPDLMNRIGQKSQAIEKWKNGITAQIENRRDITLDQLKAELDKVTSSQKQK
ncbi:VWA domain-containing protein [Patescibacteria group bacterium]|nr:VWA domain-containing protein [Patescibacteria group bacterium]